MNPRWSSHQNIPFVVNAMTKAEIIETVGTSIQSVKYTFRKSCTASTLRIIANFGAKNTVLIFRVSKRDHWLCVKSLILNTRCTLTGWAWFVSSSWPFSCTGPRTAPREQRRSTTACAAPTWHGAATLSCCWNSSRTVGCVYVIDVITGVVP